MRVKRDIYQELAPIVSNNEVLPGIYHMRVETSQMALTARPGQYVMLTCDRGVERLLRRPISVHRTYDGGLEFLYAVVGGGTQWLAQRQTGEKLDILVPLGNGFQIKPDSENLLLVAGGVGIAPLIYLAEEALKTGKNVTLLAGARTADQLFPVSMLPGGVDFKAATEDGSSGYKGLVTTCLPEYVSQADQVFICGPLPMLKAVASNYNNLFDCKSVQVSLEVRMGCGLGFCYACTIQTAKGLKQVCKDGPVFEMTDVNWADLR
jgi:dihydroorotate dehydrogenase electron transfer subunit